MPGNVVFCDVLLERGEVRGEEREEDGAVGTVGVLAMLLLLLLVVVVAALFLEVVVPD